MSSSSLSKDGDDGDGAGTGKYDVGAGTGEYDVGALFPRDTVGSAAGPSNSTTATSNDASETTSLLHPDPAQPSGHGTFSPRPMSPAAVNGLFLEAEAGSLEGSDRSGEGKRPDRRRTFSSRVKSKTMANSSALAEQHGFKDSPLMYLAYYVPCLIWIRQYNWSWLKGDFTSAVTLASMYLPMALSYADNLAHVPPINGLYAFVFNPLVYGILGSCPQMVVGPEAAGSLLIGSIVKDSIDGGHGGSGDDDGAVNAQIAGIAVGIAGATVFAMGACRLGFLDSVLSRPFLRGFISAIGVVIFIDQLIPVLGLSEAAKFADGVKHGSTADKLSFVVTHLSDAHTLSAVIGVVSFVVIMVFRCVSPVPRAHAP